MTFFNNLNEVRILPSIFLFNGFVSGLTEFNTDRIRLFLFNDLDHKVCAFPGHMGSAYEGDFLVFEC